MSNYDELIKKAQKEIEKLTAGIEKSKARIAELRANIKEYEAQKSNDLQFSDNLLELMNSNGIKTEEERKAVLAKMQEYFQSIATEKGEVESQTATPEAVQDGENVLTTETEETEKETTTEYVQPSRPAQNTGYQNPAYSYRTTNNGNYNS